MRARGIETLVLGGRSEYCAQHALRPPNPLSSAQVIFPVVQCRKGFGLTVNSARGTMRTVSVKSMLRQKKSLMTPTHLSAVVFTLFTVVSPLWAQEYAIDLESNGKKIAVIKLSIDSNEATAKVDDVTERFDLKNQRWQHAESKQWVSLAQCEAWAKQSKEKSANSAASIPENFRPFVEWSLSPKFNVEATDSAITLTSGQVDYAITVTKTGADLTNYYRYARLNAYKKAMTERKLPPFAELKVLEELERRKLMPTSMEVRIPGVPGAPEFKMTFTEKRE